MDRAVRAERPPTVPPWAAALLQCPACRRPALEGVSDALQCAACGRRFPAADVVDLRAAASPAHTPTRTRTLEEIERYRQQFERRGWIGDGVIADVPTGSAVLSIGEGFGELLVRLAERHPDRYFLGVDASEDRVRKALEFAAGRGVRNAWFCLADATNLPFVGGRFDTGYARGLLHIVPEPLPVLDEVRRVVRRRLLVDRLPNWPFFPLWYWCLQRYENVRAPLQGRAADPRIWGDVAETIRRYGTLWPLWKYRAWFRRDRAARVRTTNVFIWETSTDHAILGWIGTGGAIDVLF